MILLFFFSSQKIFFSRSRNCMFIDGRQLVFTIKKGTETSFLWKATVRIACIKFNPVTKRIESCTILNLRQFIQLFKTFQAHLETMITSEKQQLSHSFHENLLENACSTMSMSSINEFDGSVAEECCICLDRKPDLILPCLHLFCQTCIEQWNMNSKTCPVCQEKLDSAEDGWVISEFPEAGEISNEIRDSLQYISDGK